MLSSPTFNHTFSLLQPVTIELEPEHFEEAQNVSGMAPTEPEQWQIYLNTLARVGFMQWMHDFLGHPRNSIHESSPWLEGPLTGATSLCQIGDFRICLLTMEHILHEALSIPQTTIDGSSLAPHFFVAIEILEEQERLILRGFCRHDQLIQYLEQNDCHASDGSYLLPLSTFNTEVNHLSFYCRFLLPDSIIQSPMTHQAKPAILSSVAESTVGQLSISQSLKAARTNLSQWFEGFFETEWCSIHDFLHLGDNLAYSTRNFDAGAQRGKLINLGVHLKDKTVALLVNVTPELEDRSLVLAQLYPTAGQQYLSPDFKLTLLSKAGKVLQEVKARSHDNYIQLKPFRGEVGKCFSLSVSCQETSYKEDFVL
jgi:Protein of unknown function (DUF1822)